MMLQQPVIQTNCIFNNLNLDLELIESDSTLSPQSLDEAFFNPNNKINQDSMEQEIPRQFASREFNYSIYQNIGCRRENHDRFCVSEKIRDDQKIQFFSIFDGHGNSNISEYLSKNLANKTLNHPDLLSNPSLAIQQVFEQIDKEILDSIEENQINCGSTAICALLTQDKIIIINLGDCRALLLQKNQQFHQLSQEHKPSRSDEKQRIENLGGYILTIKQVQRVQGVLAISRSFGNKIYRPFISSVPEIKIYDRNKNQDEYLIIGSDGLWNEINNENIATLVNSMDKKYNNISEEIYNNVLNFKEYFKDNTTIISIEL